MARTVMDQLVRNGKVRRAQLGVTVLKIPSEEASKMGVDEGPGIVVFQVQPGSAADRAGLRKGDVITALNGTQITDPNTFRKPGRGHGAGHRSDAYHQARWPGRAGARNLRRIHAPD